ncbi:MAG: single-stranded-DNA-specific exonuclease RecJ [Bacteroidia bacterium]|nr:MAG: single-stranded-DNA-specific exonuclease RecJ [Bacteroidia bacterium]
MQTFSGLFAEWQLASPPEWTFSPGVGAIPMAVLAVLSRRGLTSPTDIEAYFNPSWDKLEEPLDLPDIDKALTLLHTALHEGRAIYIAGDYDVDGTTAAALLGDFLEEAGHKQYFLHLPDRFTEGYGVSEKAIQQAIEKKYGLFITVDCGTKEGTKLARLERAEIPVIVLDHHEIGPSDQPPPVSAFINPWRSDSAYKNKYLSAGALVLKFLLAYVQKYNFRQERLHQWVQLAALSLLADVMPLLGENRTIVYLGMEALRKVPHPGIAALMEQAGFIPGQLRHARQIVFQLVPRLNAAGRMHHPRYGLFLLHRNTPPEKIKEVAAYLDRLNRHRQGLQEKTLQEALAQIAQAYPGSLQDPQLAPPALVVVGEKWSKGIVGLVAAKLMERFYRPAVVLTHQEGGLLTGSARSPGEVPLFEVLHTHCSPYLEKFGGHARAAGLTLHATQLDAFVEALAQGTQPYLPVRPRHTIDALLSPTELTPALAHWCEKMEPIGPANEAPRFLIEDMSLLSEPFHEGRLIFASNGHWYAAASDLPFSLIKDFLSSRGNGPLRIVASPRLDKRGAVTLRLRDILVGS